MAIVYIVLAGVLILTFFGTVAKSMDRQEALKQKEEKQTELKIKKIENRLQSENAESIILCQCESTLPRIPKGDLCYLTAGEDELTIATRSGPIMRYELDYDKIYLFKKMEEKRTRLDAVGRSEEYTVFRIIVQYVDDDNSIKELSFVYGDTEADKAFNKYAFLRSDIFKVVNQKIPQRGNTVKL